ncbi:MAG: hypothetical protein K0V04_00915 [Deltaproteobacteria bacterium]|nr:hypothetical protein [Deltaproteobacteria bacterium]
MKTSTRPIIMATAYLVLATGCGHEPGPSATFDSEGWIDVNVSGPPSDRPGGEGGDDDDDDDDDESGRFWEFFGQYADGQLSELEGEFFAEDGDREVCILVFGATVRGTADDCPSCTAAWEIQLGTPQAEIDLDGGCRTHGPPQIEGLILRLGIADDVLMRDRGDGWEPAGEVLFEGDEIVLGWEAGVEDP